MAGNDLYGDGSITSTPIKIKRDRVRSFVKESLNAPTLSSKWTVIDGKTGSRIYFM